MKGNFQVSNKLLNEMTHLYMLSSWTMDHVDTPISSKNCLSISTLNTLRLKAHSMEILQDRSLLINMIVCLQENQTNSLERNNGFTNFNLNFTRFVYGVLSLIHKTIEILQPISLNDNKVEIFYFKSTYTLSSLLNEHICFSIHAYVNSD